MPFKKIETQEELDRIIGERLKREKEKYADYDELKAKLKEFEDSASDIEELKEKLKTLEEENKELSSKKEEYEAQNTELENLKNKLSGIERENLLKKVAKEHGIPETFASRLRGEDEKALNADAETLSEYMKALEKPAPHKDTEPIGVEKSEASWINMAQKLRGE